MTSWFDFLKDTALHTTLTISLWTVAGALAGILAGFLAHFGLGRIGAWRLEWPHVKWWRALTCAWLVVLFGFLAAVGGGLEGARRSIRDLVKSEPVRRELLLPLGRVGATAMAYFYCRIGSSREEAAAFVREFRDGKQEIPVAAFAGRVNGLAESEAESLSDQTVAYVQSGVDLAKGGSAGKLLKKSTRAVYRWLFQGVLEEKVAGLASSNGLEQFLEAMPASGAAGGDAATLSFEEAARHIVDHGFIPMIMVWIGGWVVMEQLLLGLALLFFALLPVGWFWILRLLEKPRGPGRDRPAA
jgi:hypothetical protein